MAVRVFPPSIVRAFLPIQKRVGRSRGVSTYQSPFFIGCLSLIPGGGLFLLGRQTLTVGIVSLFGGLIWVGMLIPAAVSDVVIIPLIGAAWLGQLFYAVQTARHASFSSHRRSTRHARRSASRRRAIVTALQQATQADMQTDFTDTPEYSRLQADAPKIARNAIGTETEMVEGRHAENALKESEDRYRDLVENITDVIFTVGENGLLTYVSPAMLTVSGYPSSEVLGRAITEFVHQPDLPFVTEGFRQARFGPIEPIEFRISTKDGAVRWCRSSCHPLFQAGQLQSIQGILTDITSQKQMETEKDQLQAQLFQVQKLEAVGTMAGGIAHDFNNILAIILGCSELIQEDLEKDTRAYGNVVEILKASQRAKELVHQLLSFNRPNNHQQRPMPLSLIVEETSRFLRALLPPNIEIRSEIDTTSGSIVADPTQIHQLLMNLGLNAKHAMGEAGGILDIRLQQSELATPLVLPHTTLQPGSYLQLSLVDTGCGMPQDVQERIFEPFFTTKPPGEGSGMGLSIVHSITASHQGAVTVKSAPGQGTSFDIYFPRLEEVAQSVEIPEMATSTGNGRILFVDDEEAITRTAGQILDGLGYESIMTTSSEEALQLFRQNPNAFDAIVTDQIMPRLTGEDLARECLSLRPDLPMVVCTGFSQTFTEEKAKSMGVREYLMKPLSKDDLGHSLQRALAGGAGH